MSTSFFPSTSTSSFASSTAAVASSSTSHSYDYSRPREPFHSHSHSSYTSSSSPSHLVSSSRPSAASPTHSSSSSTSSSQSSSSRSPMFDQNPPLPPHPPPGQDQDERGRTPVNGARTPRSQDGSVGSLATTVSSGVGSPGRDGEGGKEVVMQTAEAEGGETKKEVSAAGTGATTRGVAALSVRDDGEGEGEGKKEKRPPSSTSAGPAEPSSSSPAPTGHKSGKTKPEQRTANTSPTEHHVDIVSYPSADLLRLLAALLEQIAQANDERNARNNRPSSSSSSSTAHPPPATSTSTSTAPTTPSPSSRSRRSSVDENWEKGRFDAAPLNTPVATRFKERRSTRRRRQLGGEGGPGILDNAMDEDGHEDDEEEEDEEEEEDDYTLPLTPGVDLLRETGDRGGVEGFMPSLGGTHRPQPLSRRRGSSFIRNKRNEDGTVPVLARRASAAPSSSSSTSTAAASTSSAPTRPPPQPLPTQAPLSSFTTYQSGAPDSSSPPLTSLLTASALALSSPSATLCFHARNVPAISIEAYLQRILKYCPTTNEVFLALLVYFDRMARIGLEARRMGLPKPSSSATSSSTSTSAAQGGAGGGGDGQGKDGGLFAIDSFNVHRLVIAGVTVASKFFSDVFYTNSRYAKVGGLPLHELNQLELQFLLLNDFRLKIPTDELQRYADQLILYWVGRDGKGNPQAKAATRPAQQPTPAPAPAPTPAPAQEPEAERPAFKTPFVPTPSSAAGAAPTPSPSSSSRPPPPRTHPSYSSYTSSHSSGASVSSSVSSSTVTPGTPSTTRTARSERSVEGDGWDSSDGEEEEEVGAEGGQGEGVAREGQGEGERMDTD